MLSLFEYFCKFKKLLFGKIFLKKLKISVLENLALKEFPTINQEQNSSIKFKDKKSLPSKILNKDCTFKVTKQFGKFVE